MNIVEAHDLGPRDEQPISAEHGDSRASARPVLSLRATPRGDETSLVIGYSEQNKRFAHLAKEPQGV